MRKKWLSFNRGERNGLIILFALICLVAIYPFIRALFPQQESMLANPMDFYEIDSFFTSLQYEPRISEERFSFTETEKPEPVLHELFVFDPNTVAIADLVKLGFSTRQAAVIENFRNKGGVFRTPEDFAKMYVVSEKMFKKLYPYIDIHAKPELDITKQVRVPEVTIELPVIELNSTDTLELLRLKGIGSRFARRIVAYRQLLGGYTNVDQLKEVYGMPANLVETLKPQLWIDSSRVEKMNVNLVTYQKLREHPYLSEYQARAIIYYRETIGSIENMDELLSNKLVDTTTFHRIKGYLTVN